MVMMVMMVVVNDHYSARFTSIATSQGLASLIPVPVSSMSLRGLVAASVTSSMVNSVSSGGSTISQVRISSSRTVS